MDKTSLRLQYKAKRSALGSEELQVLDTHLLQQLKDYNWSGMKYLHCYLSIDKFKEYNTLPFIHWIWENHPEISIVISKSNFQTHTLEHFVFRPDTALLTNAWGISEPVDATAIEPEVLDAVLTPLLIFDLYGNRVGYGKGFYDRFFASCHAHVQKIGVSYFEPVSQIEDLNPWDIRLDCVITPQKIYEFNR